MKTLNSINDLRDWLAARDISTANWGDGGAKRVADLWAEILAGESQLAENPARRVVEVVQVRVQQDGRVLIEAEQELENGRSRHRRRPPSEKIKAGEDILQTALRCLQEELGLSETAIALRPQTHTMRREWNDSFSYPGLPAEYRLHTIDALVTGLPADAFWRENTASDAGDPVRRHLWVWEKMED